MAHGFDGATGRLDEAEGLTSAYRDYNAAWCDPEALIDFVTVTSDFYPELQAYYAEEAKEWLAQVEAGGRRLITSDPGAHWV